MKPTTVLLIFFAFILLSGCAQVQPNVVRCVTGETYGFLGGLWHGIILPISWICSLFNNDVAVWAVNNNGGWYTFGFVLGVGALGGGASKASSK